MRRWRRRKSADPENASALDNYARVLFEKGEFKSAEILFKKALSLEPASCIVRINYSQLLITLGRMDEAKELLDEVTFCPDYADELARQKNRVNKRINP